MMWRLYIHTALHVFAREMYVALCFSLINSGKGWFLSTCDSFCYKKFYLVGCSFVTQSKCLSNCFLCLEYLRSVSGDFCSSVFKIYEIIILSHIEKCM